MNKKEIREWQKAEREYKKWQRWNKLKALETKAIDSFFKNAKQRNMIPPAVARRFEYYLSKGTDYASAGRMQRINTKLRTNYYERRATAMARAGTGGGGGGGGGKTFTGFYVGNISWFSGKGKSKSYKTVAHAVKAHIKYLKNEKREDLRLHEGLEIEFWQRLAEEETQKRWDARVAGKLILTLPNDIPDAEALSIVKKFIQDFFDPQHIGIAIHRPQSKISGKENLHAHILFSARRNDGKKMRIGREDLRRLHIEWAKKIEQLGYTIYKSPLTHQKLNIYNNGKPDEKTIKFIQLKRRIWAIIEQEIDETLKEEKKKEEEQRKREKEQQEKQHTEPILIRFLRKAKEQLHTGRREGKEGKHEKETKIIQQRRRNIN
jgi:hypothetical protein